MKSHRRQLANICVVILLASIPSDFAAKVRHVDRSDHIGWKGIASSTWSEKTKNRQDPYAPKPDGPETVDEWCAQPEVHDPACMANPVAMTLQEEIDAVMRHMMCKLRPETCGGAEEQSHAEKSSIDKASQKQNQEPSAIIKPEVSQRPGSEKMSEEDAERKGEGGLSEVERSLRPTTGAKTEAKAGTKADAADEAKIGSKSEAKAQAKSGSDVEAGTKADEAKIGSKSEAKAQAKSGSDVEAEPEAKSNAQAEGDSWSLEKFRTTAKSDIGNSDESFKKFDKDRNGVMTWDEFQLECNMLGVDSDAECKRLFEQITGGTKDAASEEDYKDAMGTTSSEIARRFRKKYASAEEAYDAADSNNDDEVSEWEFYEQCTNLAEPSACDGTQKKLAHGEDIPKDAYRNWMESGDVPFTASSTDVAADGISGNRGAPSPGTVVAPSPATAAMGSTGTGDYPVVSSTNLLDLVYKLGNITADLEKEKQLDPELKNTLERMIDTGTAAAESLEEMAHLSPLEATVELDKMVEKAEAVDEAVFKFQTEVHPHGYKWWRYRWEYAFVEASILCLLVFFTMILYVAIHWCSKYMHRFRPDAGAMQKSSIVHLYHHIFLRCLHELNVLGVIALLIWVCEECGLFVFLVHLLPDNPVVHIVKITHHVSGNDPQHSHWPTTDQQIVYTLRSVNIHLFVGMLFYYLCMYNITLGAQCTLEQFMKHESRDFYDRFLSSERGADVTEIAPAAEVDEGIKLKAEAAHSVIAKKTPLGKALTSDATFKWVFGVFDEDEHFDIFREYIAEHVRYHEGFEDLHTLITQLPIYPYLGVKLHDTLEKMIFIDWRVWLLVEVILVLQACTHYFYHVAVVEILPFSVGLGIALLTCQYIWTRRRVHYVVDPANAVSMEDAGRTSVDVTSEQLEARENEEMWVLWLQQLNLFFLCFSAARLLFSSFFWTDYFRLSCSMLLLFAGMYLVFVFFGSLTIPMFIIMYSVPPHVTKEDREDLHRIVLKHQPTMPPRQTRMNLAKGDLRRCSTTYVIP